MLTKEFIARKKEAALPPRHEGQGFRAVKKMKVKNTCMHCMSPLDVAQLNLLVEDLQKHEFTALSPQKLIQTIEEVGQNLSARKSYYKLLQV